MIPQTGGFQIFTQTGRGKRIESLLSQTDIGNKGITTDLFVSLDFVRPGFGLLRPVLLLARFNLRQDGFAVDIDQLLSLLVVQPSLRG